MMKFHSVYLRFVVYFLLFGLIVSAVTSFVNLSLQYRSLEAEILGSARATAANIRNMVELEMQNVQDDLDALVRNPAFLNYLQNRDGPQRQHAEHLLLSHLEANSSYFQLRYLDEFGRERIRAEKARFSEAGRLLEDERLQDKSERYYFREVSGLAARQIWRSKLDLNVEHGEFERPLRPTLRVAEPVFHGGKMSGMVIINAELSRLLTKIREQANFQVYLVDSDGYFLIHTDPKKDWARYLDGGTLSALWPTQAEALLGADEYHSEHLYSFSLEPQFANREGLRLILQTNRSYIGSLTQHNRQVAAYLAAIIFIIAIPVGMFIAVWPARIQRQLRLAMNKNQEQLEIIDKYVLYSETDVNGVITQTSSAMSRMTGYSKNELIGQTHALLSSGETSRERYHEMWETISKGAVWRGEFKDLRKDGSEFWVDTTIQPTRKHGVTTGYTAISSDITDKKRISRISEEDFLTGIYNRVKLDKVIGQEMERAQRYKVPFSVIMIDADHFKGVNDRFGHGVGDDVLMGIAHVLRTQTRQLDVVGRWGGEEFMVLCIETATDGAIELAEKLRKAIENHDFTPVDKQTASFGVATYQDKDDASSLLARADAALYQAKANGRNRTVSA